MAEIPAEGSQANGPLRARGKAESQAEYLRTQAGVNGEGCAGILVTNLIRWH